VTPEVINFFLKYGKGVLCVSMTGEIFDRYGLNRPENMEYIEQTHFGQVIDLSHTITTGISATDRYETIKALTNDDFSSSDFLSYEGHVRTLEAHPEGLVVRAGHTEAAVALCEIA
jgi:3,4-dihydroxy-2-butanone 4-phosphate synthase